MYRDSLFAQVVIDLIRAHLIAIYIIKPEFSALVAVSGDSFRIYPCNRSLYPFDDRFRSCDRYLFRTRSHLSDDIAVPGVSVSAHSQREDFLPGLLYLDLNIPRQSLRGQIIIARAQIIDCHLNRNKSGICIHFFDIRRRYNIIGMDILEHRYFCRHDYTYVLFIQHLIDIAVLRDDIIVGKNDRNVYIRLPVHRIIHIHYDQPEKGCKNKCHDLQSHISCQPVFLHDLCHPFRIVNFLGSEFLY